MRKILTILLLLLLMASCDDHRLGEVLSTADSLLVEDADSALRYLEAHEGLKPEGSKGQRMRFELLRAMAQNRAYVDFTSDSVMKEVVDYYDHHGTANNQLQAHYLLGCVYRDLQEAPMALQCYQDAVEKADTTRDDCDYYTLSAVYGQMADIFHQQFLPHDELWALSKLGYYDERCGHYFDYLRAKELMIRPYYLMGDTDSVVSIIEKSYAEYKKHGYHQDAARTLPTLIYILIEKEDYDNARYYMNIYEKESGLFKSDNDTLYHGMYHYQKGMYMLQANEMDSALIYFKKLEGIYNEAAYKGLLSLYQKKGNSDSIAKYARLFAEANDASYKNKNSEVVHRMSAMYNYSRQQKLAEQREEELSQTRRYASIGIALLLLILCSVTYIYKRYKKNKRREINDLTRNLIAAEEKLTKARQARLLEKDIVELTHQLDTLQKKKAQVSKEDLEKAFFDTPVYKTFHHLSIYRLNQFPPTESDWEELTRLFGYHFPQYYTFIHQQNTLSPEQLRYAMLVRLLFTDQEIEVIMDKDRKRINNIKAIINEKIWSEKTAKQLRERLNGHF